LDPRLQASWAIPFRAAGFEGRSSLRVWLYRIATNACLTALEQRGRRALPSGLGAPSDDPAGPPVLAGPEVSWLGPIPDALVTGPAEDPAAIAVPHESLRLSLIACLQYLPARQRAVLILRDVLAFPAAEVAGMLGISTVAVKSALQRARARLAQVAPAAGEIIEPTEPQARALLGAYIAAFEHADPAALERVLRKDAALEPVGSLTWFSGRDPCMRYVTQFFGAPGDWQMAATTANGQPAAAVYLRGADGIHRAFGLAVLTVTGTGIARIVVFGDPGLVTRSGFPPVR
jgi:RNA polymerase sigma-70 factor, ECF subfamily